MTTTDICWTLCNGEGQFLILILIFLAMIGIISIGFWLCGFLRCIKE